MMETAYSVYQSVLQPMYNDLPDLIGGLAKVEAIHLKVYDTRSVPYVAGVGTTSYGGGILI